MDHEKITAEHRCDRCGAQAYAKSAHGDMPLFWCAHHLRENPAVMPFLVADQTYLLTAPPKEPAST